MPLMLAHAVHTARWTALTNDCLTLANTCCFLWQPKTKSGRYNGFPTLPGQETPARTGAHAQQYTAGLAYKGPCRACRLAAAGRARRFPCYISSCPCRLLHQHAPCSSGVRSSLPPSLLCISSCTCRVLHSARQQQRGRAHRLPCCCCISVCICCSASLVSSWKRMPTRCECFMNFSQHL